GAAESRSASGPVGARVSITSPPGSDAERTAHEQPNPPRRPPFRPPRRPYRSPRARKSPDHLGATVAAATCWHGPGRVPYGTRADDLPASLHVKPAAFRYFAPRGVEEAVAL